MEDPAVLRAVLDQATTAFAVVEGPDHLCTYANAASRRSGIRTGAPLLESFPAVDAALLDEVRNSRQGQKRRTGSWEVEATPLSLADERVSGLLIAARPVNDSRLTAEELAATLAERDKQMREVSHRVKNTLQLVSSLMTLQALTAKDAAMRSAFQEAGGRVSTVTQAHQRVHAAERERTASVDFDEHLRDLCTEMQASSSLVANGARITVEAERTPLAAESVIPLALIVNELVNNAVKHAYPSGQSGDVAVSLAPLPDGGCRLTVADHGRGLPAGFDPARADTLGMKVVRAFTGQLKGRLRAEPNHPGARFTIDLPA